MQMKKTILIVDDMEINRAILIEGFKDRYTVLEAANGREALDILNANANIAAVLLDLVMPELDGMTVLREMNRTNYIVHTPVFIITAANDADTLMEAYNLGAVDVITKPFMMNFLRCRISNIIELYRHRNALEEIINEQLARLTRQNRSVVETLASIVEFRDCESGEHVKRIGGLTDILMTELGRLYPEYYLPQQEIKKIVLASALHDVGKIAIPDGILNKPGRLTREEFETMKQHTVKGCEILESMPQGMMDEDVYNYSYDICRHHHERWDGRGYPDGLAGDAISIWAQAVSMADVYDALISPRVYKSAFDHDTAVRMICNGECGVFNPKVLDAFNSIREQIRARNDKLLTPSED
jgi:putative two-component system response regulator